MAPTDLATEPVHSGPRIPGMRDLAHVLAFVPRRLAALAITLLIASFLIFAGLMVAHPNLIPFLTKGHVVSRQTQEALRVEYHLNRSFLVRYALWLSDAVRGNLGTSILTGDPVGKTILQRSEVTALLLAYAGALIVVFGTAAGFVGGVIGGRISKLATTLLRVGLAVPAFVLGPALISLFAVKLGWFPVFGTGGGIFDQLWHLTLPAISLAVMLAAYVGRITAAAMADQLASEHVDTARARGLPRRVILRRHVAYNALIPVISTTAVTTSSILAGAVVVETIFGLQGLGSLVLQSVQGGDFPMVQGVILAFVAFFVIVNLLLDAVYMALDPRLARR